MDHHQAKFIYGVDRPQQPLHTETAISKKLRDDLVINDENRRTSGMRNGTTVLTPLVSNKPHPQMTSAQKAHSVSDQYPGSKDHRTILSNLSSSLASFMKQRLAPTTSQNANSAVVDSYVPGMDDIDLDLSSSFGSSDQHSQSSDCNSMSDQVVQRPNHSKDYDEDVLNYLKDIETLNLPNYNFMAYQADVNEEMRIILVDWLVDVHLEFNLSEETLFLTLNIVDRFLSKRQIARQKFQLVGITSMFIACKYEEIEAPTIDDFIEIAACEYSREEMITMERIILGSLEFCVTTCSVYQLVLNYSSKLELSPRTEFFVKMVAESSLLCSNSCMFRPSVVAASCIHVSYAFLPFSNLKRLELISGYSEGHLESCIHFLSNQIGAIKRKGVSSAVYNKFSLEKFMSVAHFLQ